MITRRIIFCGDRKWSDYSSIRQVLNMLSKEDTLVIHGACRGADKMSGEIAKERGFKVKVYPALWDVYGRAAGPIRNQQMLTEGRATEIIAFHKNIKKSRGTKDMINRALKKGLRVRLHNGHHICELVSLQT